MVMRHAAINEIADGDHQDEYTEQTHGQRLGQRRPRSHRHPEAQHEQADAVVGRIAEKIQRVGQQRDRSGTYARADLDAEHHQIDQ